MNNLGLAYVKIGRTDLAVEQFKRILLMDPQNESGAGILKFCRPACHRGDFALESPQRSLSWHNRFWPSSAFWAKTKRAS